MMRILALAFVVRLPISSVALLVLLQARDLGLSYGTGGLAVAGLAVGSTLGAPVKGRLIDRVGQSAVLPAGALLAAAALVALARVPASAPALLLCLTALFGFAHPPVSACVGAIITRTLKREEQRSAFALDAAGTEVSYVFGPLALVTLASLASPAAGLLVAGVLLVAGTALFALSPEARRSRGVATRPAIGRASPLRSPGVRTMVTLSAALGLGFSAVEVGMVVAAEDRDIVPLTGVLYTVWGLASLAAGIAWARRRQEGRPVPEAQALLLVLVASCAFLALSPTLGLLLVGLMIGGAAVAPLIALVNGFTGQVAPADVLTETYTWATTGLTSGFALGAAFAGVLGGAFGPGAIFLFCIGPWLVAVVVLARRADTLRRAPVSDGLRTYA
jgi:MFS family permease